MNIFLDLHGKIFNINKVRKFDTEGDDKVRVTFDDGSSETYITHAGAEKTIERFGKTIIQIIPCEIPLYNVFDNGDKTYIHDRVHFLVLCADGIVRSVDILDGYMETADEMDNFVGFFTADKLSEYPATVDDTDKYDG